MQMVRAVGKRNLAATLKKGIDQFQVAEPDTAESTVAEAADDTNAEAAGTDRKGTDVDQISDKWSFAEISNKVKLDREQFKALVRAMNTGSAKERNRLLRVREDDIDDSRLDEVITEIVSYSTWIGIAAPKQGFISRFDVLMLWTCVAFDPNTGNRHSRSWILLNQVKQT